MGGEEDALPQRLNSRQRRREQQHQVQQGTEAASGIEDGAAQAPSASGRQGREEHGAGLGEGRSKAAPAGTPRRPESRSASRDTKSDPGLGKDSGVSGVCVEVGAVTTLEPLPEYRSAAVGDYKFECECCGLSGDRM